MVRHVPSIHQPARTARLAELGRTRGGLRHLDLVVASIALGVVFGGLAFYFAVRRDDWTSAVIATFLFALTFLFVHLTGMAAALVVADPARVNDAASLSPASLSFVIAAVAAIILGISLAAAMIDWQSKVKLRQQKILLDAALD